MLARRRALVAQERGFTLVELLVATVLGLIVIGGAVTVFTVSMSNQPRINSQSAAIQQARVVMERMVGPEDQARREQRRRELA